MFWIGVFIFILVPIIELWGLISVGQMIGTIPTILLVILTGVLGVYLAKREGFKTIRAAREQIYRGEPPGEAILDGACILVGGVMLLTPGFLTDITGFLLVFPYTRKVIKRLVVKWLQKKMEYRIYRP
ncbi:FxsA family protein [Thermoflavimicrobium dichotomicum]|uniref:UPF0716 protein FxsA n=1 Tax=Thermoflavimicrobium dichotomicum TaxID=46223 RepID=A0A1I3LD10_9BACL|nr:FxsA family protein [Thermoflavimicrobium dichotomicum]SFI82396.1 UPF0716 protein FxsA [Thermoflavimicrobium dichotomicum]